MSASTSHHDSPSARREVWLHTNRRALGLCLGLLLALALAGLSGMAMAQTYGLGTWMRVLGLATTIMSLLLAMPIAYQMTVPRLAYQGGELLVYLQSAQPLHIPIDLVELFFLGHGTSLLPDQGEQPSKSRTVIIRLAEAATQWHDLPIQSAFGESRESYIILRGTWCEPLTVDVLKRLNRRLAEVHRETRAIQEAANA